MKSGHILLHPRRARARRRAGHVLGIFGIALLLGSTTRAQTILGSAANYGVMAGSTVTNTGTTTINGNLGGSNFAGAGVYSLNGSQISPITTQNQNDFTRAFSGLAGMAPTVNLTGQTLGLSAGAITLAPGVYNFATSAQLTGTLTLDAQNQSNAVWVFQIGTTLATTAGANIVFTNLAPGSAATDGLFWQVGSSTTLGAGTAFAGNVLGGTTFSFGTGATISNGRALTGSGTITLDANSIDFGGGNSGYSGGLAFTGSGDTLSAIPEPATTGLISAFVAFGLAVRHRRRAAKRCLGR